MGPVMNNFTANRGRAAFTMIEMMVVMAIMAIMMAIAVAGYIDWGRAAGMRGSVLNTQSSLSLARQWAVTHRTKTYFMYNNGQSIDYTNRGYYYVATGKVVSSLQAVSATNYLTEGIEFSKTIFPSVEYVVFALDGSADVYVRNSSGAPVVNGGSMKQTIYLKEIDRENPLTNEISIFPLTGRCRMELQGGGAGGGSTGGGDSGGGRGR